MSDKPSRHTTVSILSETYDTLQKIRERTEAKTGYPVTNPLLLREIVKFYVQAHEGKP